MLIRPPVRLASTRWPARRWCRAARDQRGDDAERRVQAGDQVGDRRAGAHGLLIGRAGHAHEAAHRLGDEVERRPVDVGTGCCRSR